MRTEGERFNKGIVRIHARNKNNVKVGAGVIVTSNGIVFTCRHNIDIFSPDIEGNYLVVFNKDLSLFEDNQYQYKIILPDLKDESYIYDFAILRIIKKEPSEQFDYVKLGFEPSHVDDEKADLILKGIDNREDHRHQIKTKAGALMDPSYKYNRLYFSLDIEAAVTYGMSGGPIYSKTCKHVIGLTLFQSPDPIYEDSYTRFIEFKAYAISMSQIYNIIKEQHKISPELKKDILIKFNKSPYDLFRLKNIYLMKDILHETEIQEEDKFSLAGVSWNKLKQGKIIDHSKSREILQSWKKNFISLIVGPSGSGKTSLVQKLGYDLITKHGTDVYYSDFTNRNLTKSTNSGKFLTNLISELEIILKSPRFQEIFIILDNIHENIFATRQLRFLKKPHIHFLLISRPVPSGEQAESIIYDDKFTKQFYITADKNLVQKILKKHNVECENINAFMKKKLGISNEGSANLWLLRFYIAAIQSKKYSYMIDWIGENELITPLNNYIDELIVKLLQYYPNSTLTSLTMKNHIKYVLSLLAVNSHYEVVTEQSYFLEKNFLSIIHEDDQHIELNLDFIKKILVKLADFKEIIESKSVYRLPHSKLAELILKLFEVDENKALINYIIHGNFFGTLVKNIFLINSELGFELIKRLDYNMFLKQLENPIPKITFNEIGILFNQLIRSKNIDLTIKIAKSNEIQLSKLISKNIKKEEYEIIKSFKILNHSFYLLITNKMDSNSIGYQIKNNEVIGLSLFNQQIRQIPYQIKNMPNLQILNLSLNNIKEIENLENLSHLKELDLSRNEIQDISGLENLSNLKKLNLGINQIKEINGLDNLKQLEGLVLILNKIEKIEGLENLSKLIKLSLVGNKIQKIEGLENLYQLRALSLARCKIRKLEGLENLHQLVGLVLMDNHINKIEGLNKLLKLYQLVLSANNIEKIEGLENLSNLSMLLLHQNKIQKIEGLEKLKDLSILGLNYNEIKKIEGLENMSPSSWLMLSDNPLLEEDRKIYNNGQSAVIKHCRKIKNSQELPQHWF